ncbi:MAG: TldD/PmbA family protein, partial [Pseudomonadota bacterium]
AADAVAFESQSVSIEVRAGALEKAERSEDLEVGLRVLMGQRQACVSSSATDLGTFAQMAERAVAMALVAPEDDTIGLADPEALARNTDTAPLEADDPSDPLSPADLKDLALRTEAAALSRDGISMVESASAAWGRRRVHLATSVGFSGGYAATRSTGGCSAITGSGTDMERDYAYEARCYAADMPAPEEMGRLAADRTLARAGSRQPPTGAFPVLFDERVAGSLVGHLLSAINGASIVRGASWLRDALGEQVLPRGMSLVEEPHRPRALASRMFDGEGLPTARKEIVSDGVLQTWILDLATGRKLGFASTANASRGTSSPPSPSTGNLALTEGAASPEELLADMGTGLLVTSMIGATINPTTGDYSRGASGMWIENGQPSYPVNECTIAGNLRDMLLSLTAANDAQPHLSRVVPSLRVEGMTIAGA